MDLPKGLIVTSPKKSSGKTVVACGIAGAINELGINIEAVKPLDFDPENKDASFFVKVTKKIPFYEPINVKDWTRTYEKHWNQIIKISNNFEYAVLMETPCSVATPIRADGEILDCVDLSKRLSWPILLVLKADKFIYENAMLAMAYLNSKEADVLGIIVTCPFDNTPMDWIENIIEKVQTAHKLYCFGILPFSPSISVEEQNQGNIITLTSNNIDLTPIQKALNLTFTVG